MTRNNDRKRDISQERLEDYDRKIEARFDKIMDANTDPDGVIRARRRIGRMHADDGGEHEI